jgi:hypothetical protein
VKTSNLTQADFCSILLCILPEPGLKWIGFWEAQPVGSQNVLVEINAKQLYYFGSVKRVQQEGY